MGMRNQRGSSALACKQQAYPPIDPRHVVSRQLQGLLRLREKHWI